VSDLKVTVQNGDDYVRLIDESGEQIYEGHPPYFKTVLECVGYVVVIVDGEFVGDEFVPYE
jgi:hypothetical protein